MRGLKSFEPHVLVGGALVALAATAAARWPEAGQASTAAAAVALLVLARRAASLRPVASQRSSPAADPEASAAGSPLIDSVLPVWRRQLDATRELSDKTNADLLTTFASISDGLDQALAAAEQAAAGLGSAEVGEFIKEQEQAIEGLLAPLAAATSARTDSCAMLAEVGEGVGRVHSHAESIRLLAKRINIVALNASIEATRGDGGGATGSGASFAVVAGEVRDLAQQSTIASREILALTESIRERIATRVREESTLDTSQEELRAQSEQCARRVISALLARLRDLGRSGRGLRDAGNSIKSEIELAMMGFQAQDRLSQMLGTVNADIERLREWVVQGNRQDTAMAAEWLDRLEKTYTMEEQRTQHFGQDAIEKQSAVEFF